MKKNIETLTLSEIVIFYAFILRNKNNILHVLFYFLIVLFALIILFKKKSRFYCIFGIIAAFLALMNFHSQNIKFKTLIPLNETESIYCKIISSPEKINDLYYSIKVKAISLHSSRFASSAKGIITVIIKGDILNKSLPGRIPKEIKNDEINIIIDKGLYLFFTGKFSEKYIENPVEGKVIFFADSYFFQNYPAYKNRLYESRAFIRYKLKHILYSLSKAGTLLIALILGCRDYLDTSMKILFQKAGLSHVLALSGMHLSVMCAFAQETADFLKKKKHHLFLMIIFSLIFVFMAGEQPSLIRALIFTCLRSMCIFFNIKCGKGKIFYLSLFIHLIIQPTSAFSLSFLLSYSAIFGILFLTPYFQKLLNKLFPDKFSKFKDLLALSAGAQTATIPIQFLVLQSFSLTGIISSIIAIPLVSLFVISGIFAIILILILPESLIIFKISLSFIYRIITISVQFFARL